MNYLLFFLYLALLCWLLTKIKFVKESNLGNQTVIILFLITVLAGITNGWINNYYYEASDSMHFHRESIVEYRLLFSDPKEYFLNTFYPDNTNNYSGLFATSNSFWNNLRSNILIKLLSIFNILSNCNYFINILFYNFLVFFGAISLYRIFIQIFPERKNTLLFTVILLPSFLYFVSGIHREGLIFLAIGIICYNIFDILQKGFTGKRLAFILSGLLLIFLLRNFVLITILPALIAWLIAEKKRKCILLVFVSVYAFFSLIFFSLKFIHPNLNLPQYVVNRQFAFIQIARQGASAININPLSPDFKSFLQNAPQALNHTLMRPYLSENKTFFYLPLALEILSYEILFLVYLFFSLKTKRPNAFVYFGIFFAVSMFLMIGYTVPVLGAIVRYRSIYLPFLITPLVCLIDLNKLKSIIH